MDLGIALSAEVPLRIERFRAQGGPDQNDLRRATKFAPILASSGEKFLLDSEEQSESADLLNRLAEAIAVLSFLPGGITAFGTTWIAKSGCGTCTMCCKLLAVRELEKPTNTWCRHCTPGKGCGVYVIRPRTCGEFECVWLQSQRHNPFGPELRPDRCKVVLSSNTTDRQFTAFVDPSSPRAWREGPIAELLAKLADDGATILIGGNLANPQIMEKKNGALIVRPARKVGKNAEGDTVLK
ncbi:MAG TPA: hypothetical protein VKV77_00185 [Methylovirgula sp.]|nr:hypothetical protein [Methylovirgula sp.]